MQSLWNDSTAQSYLNDPLQLRVYTSRLLGQNADLVLHGGGNTSVKAEVTNLFGETEQVLYIKGSGWDLGTIQAAGFAPVRLDVLLKMAELTQLSDTDMVKYQRAAMLDPNAPTPSVEAILHALIPFKFVDHTHADAVVTVSNTADGEARLRQIYGDKMLIVPYIMPGFVLARQIYEATRTVDWQELEGIILRNHGVFTFANEAKASYEQMIKVVTMAEDYLWQQGAHMTMPLNLPDLPSFDDNAVLFDAKGIEGANDLLTLAEIRQAVSESRGAAVLAQLDASAAAVHFANLPNVATIATRGPLTPDHVIRTKRIPVILGNDVRENISDYEHTYQGYFETHNDGTLTCLDKAPRWGVWLQHGTLAFGRTVKEGNIITDIVNHTRTAIQAGEKLGGWQTLPAKDIFDVEYWELEQAKLRQGGSTPLFQGKVAVVTGASSGIGRACAEALHAQGATVVGLDIQPEISHQFNRPDLVGLVCDLTQPEQITQAVQETVRRFGGIDILVSNAGIFPSSQTIAEMSAEHWERSLAINLTSHQQILQACIPYLAVGIDPAVVIIASKNVPAPGPGAGAYSVAKAGLTQLARVAALELAKYGIRVNVMHPNAIFDTAIWTPEVLEKRAAYYGMDVESYKRSNLLHVEITSRDVAALACALAGPVFSKTTGAQIPIDGGNERVI